MHINNIMCKTQLYFLSLFSVNSAVIVHWILAVLHDFTLELFIHSAISAQCLPSILSTPTKWLCVCDCVWCNRSSKELLLQPVVISRNDKEKVLIEGSINSVRVSIAVKQVLNYPTSVLHSQRQKVVGFGEVALICRKHLMYSGYDFMADFIPQ